ncbi:MAG TPA: LL-diaminopimelate aminotransferase [Candidatus Ozemobacteraceae bacterium]|nr:LL-diaminopimelate aminotransferase [Candidatus Ozemobacteraceae bacterium]
MVRRNQNFDRFKAQYLFKEIARRRREYAEAHPQARIISLGIGDTTEPLTSHIVQQVQQTAHEMGTREGYRGYGDEPGLHDLRQAISATIYGGVLTADEIFVSDGCKCDIGRLQILFGPEARITVQDPSYPAYVDSAVMMGMTGSLNEQTHQFDGITYLPCRPENQFFPDLSRIPERAIVYFCSPNNPTGAVATREQLGQLVAEVKAKHGLIVFDAAYSAFIRQEHLPRTIYEIPGAREVAIETSSFSKPAGFTGVRLGWTVVPKTLQFEDGSLVWNDFHRLVTTIFNGASIFAQTAGISALSTAGLAETRSQIHYYMTNAQIIRKALVDCGFEVFGGDNAPYIWARIPGKDSWSAFDDLLQRAQVVCTPGAGFGPAGEGFLRFSAFSHRENVEEAVLRLAKVFHSGT